MIVNPFSVLLRCIFYNPGMSVAMTWEPVLCNVIINIGPLSPSVYGREEPNHDNYQLANTEVLVTLINLPQPRKFPSVLFLQHTPAFTKPPAFHFSGVKLYPSDISPSYCSSLNKIYLTTFDKCLAVSLGCRKQDQNCTARFRHAVSRVT